MVINVYPSKRNVDSGACKSFGIVGLSIKPIYWDWRHLLIALVKSLMLISSLSFSSIEFDYWKMVILRQILSESAIYTSSPIADCSLNLQRYGYGYGCAYFINYDLLWLINDRWQWTIYCKQIQTLFRFLFCSVVVAFFY